METNGKGKFVFGDFELDETRRLLTHAGSQLNLNPKAFDLLNVLVKHGGNVVSKDELLETVWPDQFVEENNLTVQISALRKLLAEHNGSGRLIVTVPGKGYSFVAPVEILDETDEIVIEQRTIERITVERPESDTRRQLESGSRRFGYLVPAVIAAALVVLSLSGYFWRERRDPNFSSPFAGAEVKQLTTSGKVQTAALSRDGKLFAYVLDEVNRQSLWLGFVNGGNHLQLRTAAIDTRYFDLSFTSDSAQLYFSYKDDKTPAALYRIPVSGGAPEKIAGGISNFSLSADGEQIAYGRRDGDTDLLVVSTPEGANRRQIASFPKTRSFVFDSISWSPDGGRLALSKTREDRPMRNDLALVSVADGGIETIRDDSWREILKTVWLKDGSGIVVSAIKGNAWATVPKYQLFHVDIQSGKTLELTRDLSSYVSLLNIPANGDTILSIEHRQLNNIWIAPADNLSAARAITFSAFGKYDGYWGMDLTPDGKIIYTNSDTESSFISQIDADGGNSKPLTSTGRVDSVLSVSNDGRYVVFHSNRNNGDFDIWRMDADGGNPKQLTFGGKNYQPFVSADSRWVYYKSWENDVGELRRVSVDGSEPEIVNGKETSWGSASPDGKYLAASLITDKQRLAIFSAATHEIVRQFDLPKTATLYMGSHWTPDSQAVIYRDNSFGYWRQTINGGEPQRLEGLPKEKLYNFAFSKDGKQFAFVRGQEIRDVVLLKNASPGVQD